MNSNLNNNNYNFGTGEGHIDNNKGGSDITIYQNNKSFVKVSKNKENNNNINNNGTNKKNSVKCIHKFCSLSYTHHTGLSRHFRNFHSNFCENPNDCEGCISKKKKMLKKPIPKVICNHEMCQKNKLISKKNIAKHHKMFHPNCSSDCSECSSTLASILIKLNKYYI